MLAAGNQKSVAVGYHRPTTRPLQLSIRLPTAPRALFTGSVVNGRGRLSRSVETIVITVKPADALPTDEPAYSSWVAATGDRFAAADTRRVDVFVRSMLPPLGANSSQEAVLANLESLADDGTIDDVSVTITGDRLCLCDLCRETAVEAAILDRIEEYSDWGREFDASPSHQFEVQTLDSSIACETARALVPPRVVVALYCDGTLSGVFPCRMGSTTVSATDFVATIEQFSEEKRIPAEQ